MDCCEEVKNSVVSERLQNAITDLRSLQGLLLSDDLPACVLSDFRDALNRVRNAAWAAQQAIAAKESGAGSTAVLTLLAAERVRAAYQLCRALQEDLRNQEVEFQKGQLSELRQAAAELASELKARV